MRQMNQIPLLTSSLTPAQRRSGLGHVLRQMNKRKDSKVLFGSRGTTNNTHAPLGTDGKGRDGGTADIYTAGVDVYIIFNKLFLNKSIHSCRLHVDRVLSSVGF